MRREGSAPTLNDHVLLILRDGRHVGGRVSRVSARSVNIGSSGGVTVNNVVIRKGRPTAPAIKLADVVSWKMFPPVNVS